MHAQSLAYLTHVKLNKRKAYVLFEGQRHAASNQGSKSTQKNKIPKKQTGKEPQIFKILLKRDKETEITPRQFKKGHPFLSKMRVNQSFLGLRPPTSLVHLGMPKLRVSRRIHRKRWSAGRESPGELHEKNS